MIGNHVSYSLGLTSRIVQLGLPDSGQVNQDSGGLDVLFLVLNLGRVDDVQDVALAHVPHVEVVEGFDDLVLAAVDGIDIVVQQRQHIAERDRPKQFFSVEKDDVFRIGNSMFAAQLGQEFLILLREKLPYDVLERIAVHVLPLVFLLALGTSLALSFFGTFLHHLRLPLWGCFRH